MEKFFDLFKRNLKTERLDLGILEPSLENAQIVWDVMKNENPYDYKYMWFSITHKSHLVESVEETFDRINVDYNQKNGCAYYIFYESKFIGYMRVHYIENNNSLQCASVWFIKSQWGKGFNKEVHKKLEDIAFNELHVNRICRQVMADNERSKHSIESSGYHLDGVDRQANKMEDGTYMDHLWYSKLASEYKD
ncbi:MAG: GNAT family N-acetyltransferase [Alphaproteobacteria bacterium]|nr:GNAT family N-acetyltransferase [Alphaproteobacteria bacterium]